MKKNLFLAAGMLFLTASAVACGGGASSSVNTPTSSADTPASSVETPASSVDTPVVNAGSIKIWVADNIVDLTNRQLTSYKEAHPEFAFDFTIEAMGEGDAASKLVTDVETGADIYCFAQDQFSRLYSAGALTPVASSIAEEVESANDRGSVRAATFDDTLYAYPLTSDNGYFMYYDKSVIAPEHVGSLEAILADCEAADKLFSYEYNSGWYNASFFFATGCESTWTTVDGKFAQYTDTYNSEAGLVALKGMEKITSSKACNAQSNAKNGFEAGSAVVVSGTWDYNSAVESLGDNLGVAKLPEFEVDGAKYQMGSFSGNKLMGVKPQADAEKAAACQLIAQYLTGAASQEQRFDEVAWGPSNKVVQRSEKVAQNPALAALNEQNNFAVPQGQYPGGWWDLAKAIGDTLKAGSSTHQEILDAYSGALDGLLEV